MQLGKLNTIGLIVGICGGIAGLGAAILAEASTGNFPWGSVSIALLFIVIFGGVFWFIFRPMLQAQAVLKSGQPAEATVLKLSDTGVTLNENPEVKLLLEVRPPGQAPFQAETKTFISRLETSMVQPGTVVQVRYDPHDTSKVAIESFGGEPASGQPTGAVIAGGLPTGAISVGGQTYASVDEMPPQARQAYEQVMKAFAGTYASVDKMPPQARQAYEQVVKAFADTNGDGVPDILKGQAQAVVPPQAPEPSDRLKELKKMMDEGLITIQEYEAKKAEILAKV